MEKIKNGLFRITGYVADAAGCGNIRVIIPFTLLNQLQVKNFQFQSYFNNMFTKDVSYYKNSTIIQFQRAATEKHLAYFEIIRRKIKILTRSALVYEIDDDLYNIPKWNYAYNYYSQYRVFISEMLSKADGIIVSTQKLKELYSPVNKNIHIIPNYLPRYTWGEDSFNANDTQRPRIIYPCSTNHFSYKRDVPGGDMSKELMGYVRKTTTDYDWHFIGGMPMELEDLVKAGKITRHGWLSVYEYPRFLKSLKGDIGIAPLDVNEFNKSKSNIKSLEYTALGVPGVFTKLDPYDTMSLQAESDEEFISHIESLKDINHRHQAWLENRQTLGDNLYWEDNSYKNLKLFVKTYLNLIGKDADL